MASHYYFEAPLPDFRSTWAILKSPVLRSAAIAERTSLSTNGITAHPSEHIPEPITSYFSYHFGCSTSRTSYPAPPPSSEPTVTVSLTEFRGLERSLRTLSTAQDSIIHQMATIRAHHDQNHCYSSPAYHDPSSDSAAFEYADTFGHDRSAPSEPLVPDEESLPVEQPIPEEQIRAEPSHDPTTI
ncbi:hypothetical protein CK203_025069 [Vitis vinifera]|uniref:Uncharacterized protein n=1 Tax=Vitis vinifera TaxID=29760 RepID=A0A438E732_VITVI|nr:hypothetical protein CK203_107095 [Vitis vinifera]RVX04857.1 hypothetical protein CK203_025069 [Vitis vinifera]